MLHSAADGIGALTSWAGDEAYAIYSVWMNRSYAWLAQAILCCLGSSRVVSVILDGKFICSFALRQAFRGERGQFAITVANSSNRNYVQA